MSCFGNCNCSQNFFNLKIIQSAVVFGFPMTQLPCAGQNCNALTFASNNFSFNFAKTTTCSESTSGNAALLDLNWLTDRLHCERLCFVLHSLPLLNFILPFPETAWFVTSFGVKNPKIDCRGCLCFSSQDSWANWISVQLVDNGNPSKWPPATMGWIGQVPQEIPNCCNVFFAKFKKYEKLNSGIYRSPLSLIVSIFNVQFLRFKAKCKCKFSKSPLSAITLNSALDHSIVFRDIDPDRLLLSPAGCLLRPSNLRSSFHFFVLNRDLLLSTDRSEN